LRRCHQSQIPLMPKPPSTRPLRPARISISTPPSSPVCSG
jgi:hypothetical protein